MPQGNLKTKVKIPTAGKKKKITRNKKANTLKKGNLSIAPKKANLVATAKLKKNLKQAIDKKIEKEVILQAGKNNVGLRLVEQKKKAAENKKT